MPRILAPRNESFKRSTNSLLGGSKSSLGSNSSKRTSASNPYHASQFALRRSAINGGGSNQSSTHSLRHQALQRHRDSHSSRQNAVWNFESRNVAGASLASGRSKRNAAWDLESTADGPPSLASSEASAETERADGLSVSSSQSSLRPNSPGGAAAVLPDARQDLLRRYRARAAGGATLPGVPNPRGPTILHPVGATGGAGRGSRSMSFLPSARIREDDVWGQFVDVADADEDLVRRSRLLSLKASAGSGGAMRPDPFQLRR